MKIIIILFLIYTNAFGYTVNGISAEEKQQIGMKIYKNECNSNVDCLTSWNDGEYFASLGIGHFIWYPKDVEGQYHESFPELISYMENLNIEIPRWLKDQEDLSAPWSTKDEFYNQFDYPEMKELRLFLLSTFEYQIDFMMNRFYLSISAIVDSAPPLDQVRIVTQFKLLMKSPKGFYALVDYVNFKGEGISLTERYEGQGWGLLQVLMNMPSTTAESANIEFAKSAEIVLTKRVANSPNIEKEKRWLIGWLKRVETYK